MMDGCVVASGRRRTRPRVITGYTRASGVTRAHPRDNSNHVVLATQTHKPKDFAAQINLSVANMWGIFKAVNDLTKKLPDGKYLLVKDPNKPLLRLYEIAADAFDNTYE